MASDPPSPTEHALATWRLAFGETYPIGDVLAANASATVRAVVPGKYVVFVRRIDRGAQELISRHPRLPVHLWFPESLVGLANIEAESLVITAREAYPTEDLYDLNACVRDLTLNGNVCSSGALRVERLGMIQRLTAPWSMFDPTSPPSPNMIGLGLFDPGPHLIDQIPAPDGLQELGISRPSMASLEGITRFSGLKRLEIGYAPLLRDIRQLADLRSLEVLELSHCKRVGELQVLSALPALKRLHLIDMGRIESLEFLRGLQHLRWFVASGSTVVADGDLSPLLTIRSLECVALASRRHYRPSVGDLRRSLSLGDC
jgi:hypothetical protein